MNRADRIDAVAEAIRDRLVEHGYAMSMDTARDLAGVAIDAGHPTCPLDHHICPWAWTKTDCSFLNTDTAVDS